VAAPGIQPSVQSETTNAAVLENRSTGNPSQQVSAVALLHRSYKLAQDPSQSALCMASDEKNTSSSLL
jgi:hypothetical protein